MQDVESVFAGEPRPAAPGISEPVEYRLRKTCQGATGSCDRRGCNMQICNSLHRNSLREVIVTAEFNSITMKEF
jgi:hypothetical protein